MPVAPLLGGAACGVALDQEQFGLGGVTLLTVGQLAGQGCDVHRALAAGQLARLLGGLARGGGVDHLLHDHLAVRGIFFQPLGHLVRHQAFQGLAHFGTDQLVLGLRREFGIGQLHRHDRGKPFAHILASERNLLLLERTRFFRIAVECAGQRRAERGQMRAAVALRNVVRETQHIFIIAVIPFQRDVDGHIVARARDRDRIGHQRILVAIQIFDEGGDPALIEQLDLLLLLMPGIHQEQAHAAVEEGQLAIAMLQLVEIIVGLVLERAAVARRLLGRRQESDARALLPFWRIADHLQRRGRVAIGEAHIMFLAVPPDIEVQPFGQGVDHRYAHAMQAARHLVGIVVRRILELPARMQLGHDDLGRRHALFLVDAGRNAAAIILDADRPIGVERNDDPVAMAGQRLVDRIVADLEHHMVQAAAIVGVANIHAGPLAHGVQALQHLDAVGAIIILVAGNLGFFAHAKPIGNAPVKLKRNMASFPRVPPGLSRFPCALSLP